MIIKRLLDRYKWLSIIITIVTICGIAIIIYLVGNNHQDQTSETVAPAAPPLQPSSNPVEVPTSPKIEQATLKVLPEKVTLKVPFASQAPYGDWSEPYENACEEASIIMVSHFFDQQSLTKDEMKANIDRLVVWQEKNWSGHFDLTSEQTIELAKNAFHLKGTIVTEYQVERIKHLLADGYPVIIPSDGKKLNNPNFRNGGPNYHMLVITGYDSKGFITNDPGTRKGENYHYDFETIINAVKNPSSKEKSVFYLMP